MTTYSLLDARKPPYNHCDRAVICRLQSARNCDARTRELYSVWRHRVTARTELAAMTSQLLVVRSHVNVGTRSVGRFCPSTCAAVQRLIYGRTSRQTIHEHYCQHAPVRRSQAKYGRFLVVYCMPNTYIAETIQWFKLKTSRLIICQFFKQLFFR